MSEPYVYAVIYQRTKPGTLGAVDVLCERINAYTAADAITQLDVKMQGDPLYRIQQIYPDSYYVGEQQA